MGVNKTTSQETQLTLANIDGTEIVRISKQVSGVWQNYYCLFSDLKSWVGPPYKTYQAFITQGGTTAPVQTLLVNDFTGITFTWSYTGAGIYALTASSPIFTSGKTGVLLQNPIIDNPPGARFAYYDPGRSSTSVVTIVSNMIQMPGATIMLPTDNSILNCLMEVRVYN